MVTLKISGCSCSSCSSLIILPSNYTPLICSAHPLIKYFFVHLHLYCIQYYPTSMATADQIEGEANDSDCGPAIHANSNLITYSSGDNSALMAEH
ncbi:hypothetical protein ACB092_12G092600 [Castanea dentata]